MRVRVTIDNNNAGACLLMWLIAEEESSEYVYLKMKTRLIPIKVMMKRRISSKKVYLCQQFNFIMESIHNEKVNKTYISYVKCILYPL
jgi:hypothetical protein